MNIAIWVIQVLLALAFIGAGFMKLTQPIERLAPRMKFVNHYSVEFVRFIGAVEVLGGIGLIIPALLNVLPWLTPVAAIGLAVIMAGAVYYHATHNETNQLGGPLVLGLLALVVVIGRFALVPIA